jgi:signal transduction histidine kinase
MEAVTLRAWLAAASAAVFFSLALVSGSRRARHPLALHLGLMCAGLFAYNLAEVLSVVEGGATWVYLSDGASALTAVFTFELFVRLLGFRIPLRRARVAVAVYFGLVATLGFAPLVAPNLAEARDRAFPPAMLVGLVPLLATLGRLVWTRARTTTGVERARVQLAGAALVLGVGSVLSDLVAMVGFAAPRLSYAGLLLSSFVLAALALEARLLERAQATTLLNALVIALVAVGAQVLLVSAVGRRTELVTFGTLVVVLVTVGAIAPLVGQLSEQRARAAYLTTLGRMAQQMAHDLRNPLAAIKGAAQFLEEERRAGRSIDGHEAMLALIVERADRVERSIADYQRMGRVEPRFAPVDLAPLLADAAALAGSLGEHEARGEVAVDGALPLVTADADLLAFAFENLVRNACESMPKGGTVTLSARAEPQRERVRIEIADQGEGMSAETRERVLDGLYTTKDGGSGLGLGFARRVIEAHRGHLRIQSELGRGTRVEIELPLGNASPLG